jgi:hypothetical protein
MVFFVGSVPRSYKRTQKRERSKKEYRTMIGRELGRVLEVAVESD